MYFIIITIIIIIIIIIIYFFKKVCFLNSVVWCLTGFTDSIKVKVNPKRAYAPFTQTLKHV